MSKTDESHHYSDRPEIEKRTKFLRRLHNAILFSVSQLLIFWVGAIIKYNKMGDSYEFRLWLNTAIGAGVVVLLMMFVNVIICSLRKSRQLAPYSWLPRILAVGGGISLLMTYAVLLTVNDPRMWGHFSWMARAMTLFLGGLYWTAANGLTDEEFEHERD